MAVWRFETPCLPSVLVQVATQYVGTDSGTRLYIVSASGSEVILLETNAIAVHGAGGLLTVQVGSALRGPGEGVFSHGNFRLGRRLLLLYHLHVLNRALSC
jgi:hypothetical protein